MRWSVRVLTRFATCVTLTALPAVVEAQAPQIPAWLNRHVGYDDGQIAPVVLLRARDLYLRKRAEGAVRNGCYLAMDATKPSTMGNEAAKRFYVICEDARRFRAVSSGYGNGRNLQRANFANGRQCAKHFSNAEGSKLTMGGNYMTAETRTSFKGYYKQGGEMRPFYRSFLQFEGEGETKNARERAIGGHQAMFLKWQCRTKDPSSRHADDEGYVPVGQLVDYTAGRSNGCTTWSAEASAEILKLVGKEPTTLYLYPESKDIDAVAQAVARGQSPAQAGAYWNEACLREIGAPTFWPKRKLQPIINEWRRSLPKNPPLELPICK